MAGERPVILDTGPLVAFIVEREPNHVWADQQFRLLPAPFLTCEAVLTEALHLLSRTQYGSEKFFEMLSHNVLVVDFALNAQIGVLKKMIHKYQDLPMSLADACLVRMAVLHPTATVLTLDHHFKIYRKHGRQAIPLIKPKRDPSSSD